MFCPNCGTELLPGAKFCAACGTPAPVVADKTTAAETSSAAKTSAKEEPEVFGGKTFTLTIKHVWIDIAPTNTPVVVTIDDNVKYEIEEGKSVQVPVLAGTHKVTFYGFLRSKSVSVLVSQDRTLSVRWSSMFHKWKVKEEP